MLDSKLEDDIFSNDAHYYFSLLSDRFTPLNKKWQHALELRFKKKFKPIYVLSFKHNTLFAEDNYIVLNKDLVALHKKLGRSDIINLIYPEELNKQFSESNQINNLIDQLAKKQGKVFILSFSSVWLNMNNPNAVILGPDPKVAALFDDKVSHIETFKKLGLPVNKSVIYKNFDELRKNHTVFPFFLSATFSSGGIESKTIYTAEDLDVYYAGLRPVNRNKPFIAYELISDIVLAPNTTALVSEDGVTVLSISDQILRNHNYMGNTYPSVANESDVEFMKKATQQVGSYIKGKGFRGLFGMDFLITASGACIPVDLNPRRQGGYYCLAMSSPMNIIDLELKTVFNEPLPSLVYEQFQCTYHWAHSKLSPYYHNVTIKKQFNIGDSERPFRDVGTVHKALYYPKDHMLIMGNPGFYLKTSSDREGLENNLYADIEKTISTTYELYE